MIVIDIEKLINKEEQNKFEKIVNSSLDKAEKLVKELNVSFDECIKVNASIQRTNIPGYKFLGQNEYHSDDFLAFMLDMRDSFKHLTQEIRDAKVSNMKRVFYEVSALLPVLSSIVENTNCGSVTEYLGDGFLALFQFPKDKESRDNVCVIAMETALKCFYTLDYIINPILLERYNLPELEMGIGMSFSEAIVTNFGINTNSQIKVIGKCVYDVSKLSKGRNKIILDSKLENIYPQCEEGSLCFEQDEIGYSVNIIGD